MIDHDNLSDYADAILYDLENPAHEPSQTFYLTMAKKYGGPVLELGCGSGRFTIPIARAGIDITGLDIVPGMLARARDKAGDLPIQWVEANARTFHLDRTFGFIFESGGMFQHLLTREDAEAMLACVRRHLPPDGRFLIHTTFPKPNTMTTSLVEEEWFCYEDENGREIRVSGTDRYDALTQIRHETAVRRWQNEAGETVERIAPLALRQYFPQELESLLHYNGFSIIHRYGDWDFSPLTGESNLIILLCQKSEEQL